MTLFHIYRPTSDPTWLLTVDGFDPALEPTVEAVQALVNGYHGTRASVEEGSSASKPGAFIAGVFNTPARPQAPELQEPISEIVNTPNWMLLHLHANGAPLTIDDCTLLEQRRTLDLRQGVLTRTWRLQDDEGRITALRSLRFASLANRHVLYQSLEITPENYSGPISVAALIDGAVLNERATPHIAVQRATAQGSEATLHAQTLASSYTLAYASHASLYSITHHMPPTPVSTSTAAGQSWTWQGEQGKAYTLERLVTVATSRDGDAPGLAISMRQLARATGMAALLSAHTGAWARRWATCDAAIAGDAETQQQVRWALYHLAGAAHPADERSSVGARSLTGERYRGHVFWDTETFVWPFFLYTEPATARALLMYRYHNLAGARDKARAMGYRGALFPWESTDTGDETTPPFVKVPGGELLPILTGIEEHHISADIAYAVVQYRQVTGDDVFFLAYGAELLLDIARFWASRAEADAAGVYHIRRVIGPDEYHETVDDNAYTNVLAAWVLRQAHSAAEELRTHHHSDWERVAGSLALTDDELSQWAHIAGRLATNYDPATHLYEQFTGYHHLQEIDLSDHDTGDRTMDVKLGWANLQQTKTLKQADVVMLQILLWDELPAEAHAANFAYYEPRTAHDSSLSPSMHALVAARLGDLTLAERYIRQAARIDLDFTRKGWAGATGGVHIAALGGIWQALAFGFLGAYPHQNGIRFRPNIPAHWGSLTMALTWRGSRLRITATPAGCAIEVIDGGPVRVAIGNGPWQMLDR